MHTDGSVECSGPTHRRLVNISLTFLVLVPIGVPLLYLWLLVAGRHEHRTNGSLLAQSTRFLWRGYKETYFWCTHRM